MTANYRSSFRELLNYITALILFVSSRNLTAYILVKSILL
ncbi:hypothetical protein T12_201 [Trichinella patagoniensis]|uniref:Uncharacterized protein n=1 Tax=Trichinella patagoniensis TaxID=990121 RepID=A0A0V0YTB5_9BILA|nr:hypothetical protein T12_201 [Trichinella patagoniensis]